MVRTVHTIHRVPGRGRGLRWLVLLTLMALSGAPTRAQDKSAPEYQVKAGFLYNFAKLTEWPAAAFADTNAPLVIGVLGKDPFGRVLDDTVKEKWIEGRKVIVRRCQNLVEAQECHVLFTAESDPARQREIITHLSGRPVLTVGQGKGFAGRGGIINFTMENKHVRFEINATQAKAGQLKISSRLLRLAVIVKSEKD